jgi:hypothetical protein
VLCPLFKLVWCAARSTQQRPKSHDPIAQKSHRHEHCITSHLYHSSISSHACLPTMLSKQVGSTVKHSCQSDQHTLRAVERSASEPTSLLVREQVAWEALVAAAEAAGMHLRKLDRKAEKAMVQGTRAALMEKLEGEEEPPEVLSLAVPLIVAQVRSVLALPMLCQ